MAKRKKSAARKKAGNKRAPAKERPTKRASSPDADSKGACFVLLPFHEPFDTLFVEAIEPAIREIGLEAVRGDSVFAAPDIIADVWSQIQKARVLIAVLTDKNPNVFYELGLAHAVRQPVVLVSNTLDDVPFDLRHLRVVPYDKEHPKWGERLQRELVTRLTAVLTRKAAGVPRMFRAEVERKELEDTESARLAELERRIEELEAESPARRVSSRRGIASILEEEARYLSNHDQAVDWARRARDHGMGRGRIESLLHENIPAAEVKPVLRQIAAADG